MQLTTFFSHWFSARGRHLRTQMGSEMAALPGRPTCEQPHFLSTQIRADHAGQQPGLDQRDTGSFRAAGEHFQRRFRQLAAGGWSFRAATAIARFDCLIEAEPL